MLMKGSILFLIVAVARGAPEFVGVMSSGQELMFAIMETASDIPPKWVRLNGDFLGYRIASYRSAEEILVLERGDVSIELKLRDSKVRSKRAEITAEDAYAVAIREVQKREDWALKARFDKPQRGPKNWLIPVFHRLADGREECVLVGVGLATGDIVEYSHFDPHANGMRKRLNNTPEPTKPPD